MKRILLLLTVCFTLVGCDTKDYFCYHCGRYHHYNEYCYYNCCDDEYHDGYWNGYTDGYGQNADFVKLVNGLTYSQWYVDIENDQFTGDTKYFYDFDNFRQGYMTITLCQFSDGLSKLCRCFEYNTYRYSIVTMVDNRTLIIRIYMDDVQKDIKIEFSAPASNGMTLYFHSPNNTYNVYQCKRYFNYISESELLNKMY